MSEAKTTQKDKEKNTTFSDTTQQTPIGGSKTKKKISFKSTHEENSTQDGFESRLVSNSISVSANPLYGDGKVEDVVQVFQ